MDFDDDDDWDANALETLEAQAINAYTATQQRTMRHTSVPAKAPSDDTSTNILAVDEDTTRLAKLVRDKEGELLILRSNIARTSAEHATALEKLKDTNRTARQELERQLELQKSRVTQLETSLTFQLQELREAKLVAAQRGLPSRATSPRSDTRHASKINGFPEKSVFERSDASLLSPRSRKRKRTNKTADSNEVDDFDLAELKLQRLVNNGTRQHSQQHGSSMDFDDRPCSPIVEPPTMASAANFTSSGPPPEDATVLAESRGSRTTLETPRLDLWAVQNALSDLSTSEGENCIAHLSQVKVSPQHVTSFSIGQVFLKTFSESSQDHSSIFLRPMQLLASQTIHHREIPTTVLHLLIMMHGVLQWADSGTVIEFITWSIKDPSDNVVLVLQELVSTTSAMELSSCALQIIDTLAVLLDRNVDGCDKLKSTIKPTFIKILLSNEDFIGMRKTMLRIIANVATEHGSFTNPLELLDQISACLINSSTAGPEYRSTKITAVQCLYCIILFYEDALAQARTSRHVIPRLVRSIANELDCMYSIFDTHEVMVLLRMLIKLYHILLHDDDVTSELHWRNPEVRAAHLTSMTRVLYAEEHENFDTATQDLAMDLLEMAISPEEGNDIYEVMGNVA